ncbi:hypothetical protein L9F63_016737 [Diploptera punctata]|uniref:Globin domain-containing protein n=1 Tax=Diploptera punctata TaxID=6984 RepID=A0AAD8A0J5_DIPPU|nr:hypothetical protein L9F63_016737 [Diploptera punctata]
MNRFHVVFRALRMYPAARKQFRTFAHVPLEQLKDEPTFRQQGHKTLSAVNRVVADLHDEEKLAAFLKEIGQMHKRRKVPTDDFKTFHVAVVQVMKSTLGPALSADAEATVYRLMKKMIKRIIQEYYNHPLD